MATRKILFAFVVAAVLCCGRSGVLAQSLYTLPEGVDTRWASAENPLGEKGKAAQTNGGRKGRPAIPVKAGEQVTLAEVRGSSGTVRRIWATISDRSPAMLRGLKIEMSWDGATKPAVSAPFGDFFGFGLGRMVSFQSALFASPEARSFNCYIPMPFRSGMKIVLTNESGKDLQLLFYDVDYTLGDKHGANDLYFHAHYRRENPTALQHDFEILPQVSGNGRFLGANICVQANKKLYVDKWWGEGEVKMYLDGDRKSPTLAGTGAEDYVGTSWGIQNQYANLYQGSHFVDADKMRSCFYRYHIPDPVYFKTDIRVTVQQIGFTGERSTADPVYHTGAPIYNAGPGLVEKEKGSWGMFERQDDWSSVAYFYLDRPEDDLPSIDPPEERMKGLAWGGPYFGDVQ
jgi:Protein of unknown function (DUF2961)